MVWGAFTAGLHAGEAYNTWPLMDGEMLPAAAFTILPKWHNIFENLALVQFIHRWLGPTTMIVIILWAMRVRAAGWKGTINAGFTRWEAMAIAASRARPRDAAHACEYRARHPASGGGDYAAVVAVGEFMEGLSRFLDQFGIAEKFNRLAYPRAEIIAAGGQ